MSALLGILVMTIAVLTITACEVTESPFVGTWVNSEYGTIKITSSKWNWTDTEGETISGTYSEDGNTATFKESTSGVEIGTATVSGSTLTVNYLGVYTIKFNKR
jgi:hypothetical protein